MPRLDIERQALLEPIRIKKAMKKIKQLGFNPHEVGSSKITFEYKNGNKVYFWPYSGWHSGKDIEDGRGLEHLLKQLIKK